MNQGENVLMVLDQDSNEVRFLVGMMCPTTGILSESRTKFIFFQFTKKGDHCNGLGT
jgi:excinuclease ABC subunit A